MYPLLHVVTIFCLFLFYVVRILKIYSLGNSGVSDTILLTAVTAHCTWGPWNLFVLRNWNHFFFSLSHLDYRMVNRFKGDKMCDNETVMPPQEFGWEQKGLHMTRKEVSNQGVESIGQTDTWSLEPWVHPVHPSSHLLSCPLPTAAISGVTLAS